MQGERDLESSFRRFRDQADVRALARVFDASAPELLAVARHLTRQREDAEDLVQATFLTAIEKATSYDGSRPVTPWLLGILSLHAHVLRARHGRGIDSERLRANEVEPPERAATSRELAEAVASAVAAMPEAYAAVVRRYLVDGARPSDLASELGISPVNARVRLHRGLKLLRAQMPSGFAGVGLGWLATWRSLRALRRAVLEQASARTGAAVSSGLATSVVVALLAVAAFSTPAWLPLIRGAKDGEAGRDGASIVAAAPETSSPGQRELGAAAAPLESEDARAEVASSEPAASSARSASKRTIRGRLLLPSGAPAHGASVELSVSPQHETSWRAPAPVRTAADGTFSITCEPPPKLLMLLEARHAQLATIGWRWNDLSSERDVDLGDATFERAGILRVALTDARGEPLSTGWVVDAFDASESRRGNQDMVQRRVPVLEDGTATIDDIPQRRFRVHASCGSLGEVPWTQVDVAAGATSELALKYDGPDTRRRIGVTVRVRAPGNALDVDEQHVKLTGRDGRVRTASAPPNTVGRFVFDDLELGEYALAIDDPRFAPFERAGVATGESVRAELSAAASIALRVRGADGRDVERYSLSATFVERNTFHSPSKLRSAGDPLPAGGVYASFLPGDARLEITIDGAPAKSVTVEKLVAGETRAVEVSFGGALALSGRVLEQDGARPAAGATVELLRGSGVGPSTGGMTAIVSHSGSSTSATAAMSTTTAEDGSFRFAALDPGTWTVRAQWNALLTLDRVVEVTDEPPPPIELAQPPSGWFEGVVETRGAGGRWIVTARPSELDPFLRSLAADVGEGGKFRLGPLPVGRFRVDASAKPEPGAGWGSGSVSFATFESLDEQHPSYAIEAGKVTALRLGAAGLPTAVAKVRVVVDGGSIDGATLVADASSGSSSSYARADVVDGLATLRNVPAGSYVLTLRAADESWSWRSPQPVELRASETVETELSLRLARRTVRVVGEDSKPIARREISASTGGGNSRPLGTTGDEGEIDLTLPEGRVLFACAGFALKPEQVDWSRGETPVVLVAAKER